MLALDASPVQVALLGVADLLPGVVLGLFAGAWVDRVRRRPLMIGADLVRAALVGSVPVAALVGALALPQLYIVALGTSALSVVFDLAYAAYLPSIVNRSQLVAANSRLEATNSVAEVGGFGLAGLLVQLLSAPIALLVDAATFLFSAAALGAIRRPEPPPRGAAAGAAPSRVLREIVDGLRVLWSDRTLRALAGASATSAFFAHIFVAVLTLFLVETLRLQPVVFGLVFGLGGLSALVGALFVERATRRWGVGPTMVWSLALSTLSTFLIPLASGSPPVATAFLAAGQAFDGTGMAYQINRVSLIQAVTPPPLLGRVNAGARVLEQGAMLVGLLAGGALGEAIGIRPTVFLGVAGMLLALPWLLLSPVPRLRALPGGPALAPRATADSAG